MKANTVISDDLALCDEIVEFAPFRRDGRASDANVYESSDAKEWLEDWAIEHECELPIKAFEMRTANEKILCPICGSKAKLNLVPVQAEDRSEYKVTCSKSALHVSNGCWFRSKEKAWEDWARRCTGYGQPEWYHPTNREMLARAIKTASEDAKSFAQLVIETGKKFDGWTEEEIAEYFKLRYDYGFCGPCKQFGQEFCICNRVYCQKVIDQKNDEI